MSITYKELKGPKGLPIIGSIHKIELANFHNQLEEWSEEYGKVYKLILGPNKVTVITDPEITQTMLKERPGKFRRMSKMDEIMVEIGVHGVFNAEGDVWKTHRRIVNKGLDVKHQQQFYPEILISLERLFNKWDNISSKNQVLNIQQDLLRFTVDVTTSLAFGYKMNTLEQEGDVIQNHLEKIFPMIFKRMNDPFPFWRYYRTKKDKIFDNAVLEINKLIDEFILDGKKKLKDNPALREHPTNFLESLLVAAEEEDTLTDEDVRGNLLTILMAGEDTTAHTLAWSIYLLAQHPEVQDRLHEEAKTVLNKSNWLEKYNSHSSLLYTEAVAMETMRIKPVAPLIYNQALEDVEINGYLFKKDSKLLIESRYAGMQDDNFSNAKEFKPERWIKQEKGKCPMGHDTKAYIPFGAGARFCPGKNLAMLEMKLVLSMLMKNFKVELITPANEVKEVMAFTMMPSEYQVKLIKRD
ncbi:MAG: cytochrome P450 [Flavobacteriales bacterium]|nr:MAG: cytochrome P450 [Flavobacteriales bacterium]